MRVIYRLNSIKSRAPSVVSMGVFDGVHRAHRSILNAAVKKARLSGMRSVAVTFWPHPQKEKTLYSLQHRLNLIGSLGLNTCLVIRFDKDFSRMNAERFISDILVKRLQAKYIYVGEDFRFGHQAKGDARLLLRLSDRHGFKVRLFKTIRLKKQRISSTLIRRLISEGELKKAASLLGSAVSVLGTVVKGDSVAKELGFPTANIDPHHEVTPPSGVYAVRAILGNRKFSAICYIGRRPTLIRERRLSHKKNIEVFIFNFGRSIYGKTLLVEFVKKIREEKKFSSAAELVVQIKKDILRSKRILPLH